LLRNSCPGWIGAIGFVLLAASCSGPSKREVHADEGKNGSEMTVAVAKVTREDLSRNLVLAAEFRPYQEIEVHAKIAGYLKQILVDVGDRVKAGQVLAILEIPEMQDEAIQAAATKRRSEAELVRARSELERAESAHQATHLSYQRMSTAAKTRPGLIAQQEIDDALARDRVTEAQVATAKAAITAAEQQVAVSESSAERVRTMQAYMRITAPFAGVISKRYADTGAMIQAGTASQSQAMPVVRLSQNDRLRLVLPVPESVVPDIHIGTPVEVRVQTLGRSFEGHVSRFAERVASNTRTMETEVDVPNPRMQLVPGMYAEGLITLESRKHAIAVPLQAVSGMESKPTVLVAGADGRLERRSVKLGIETPEKAEILKGLNEGDLVVIGKQSELKPGTIVRTKLIEEAEKEK
jgi:RND family efflux transporter MFP subunit